MNDKLNSVLDEDEIMRIQAMGLNGIKIMLGKEEVILQDIDKILEIADKLYSYGDFYIRVQEIADLSVQLLDIETFLQNNIVEKEDGIFYNFNLDVAYILQEYDDGTGLFDNTKMNNILNTLIETEFKNNEIFFNTSEFEVEFYTTIKEDAILFLNFVLSEWISPFLASIFNLSVNLEDSES